MIILDENWTPEWGEVVTWFGIDKNGMFAIFLNNGWGWLPQVLLEQKNLDDSLGTIINFIYEDNEERPNINSKVILDMYSYWLNKESDYSEMQHDIEQGKKFRGADERIVMDYGFCIYQGVEGYEDGEDYPVGYEGVSKRGDYYRYLVPSSFGSIDMLPKQLHPYIAMSDILDFTKDRLLDNNRIDEYFPRTATGK